jgi:pimeloyl-ACP methyl ester carboxylesterase
MIAVPRLILIPGLGYDCRIFERLDLSGYEHECLSWIEPESGEPMAQYAQRMYEQIEEKEALQVLIGHSFGGMMAQEIAAQFDIEKVILLGSVKSRDEVPSSFKMVAPLGVHRLFSREISIKTIRYWGASHGFETKEDQALFKSMVGGHSNNFLRWALKALSSWQRTTLSANTSLAQVHGTNDKTFPFSRINKLTISIQDGSHIFVYKKPEMTSAIIRELLSINP